MAGLRPPPEIGSPRSAPSRFRPLNKRSGEDIFANAVYGGQMAQRRFEEGFRPGETVIGLRTVSRQESTMKWTTPKVVEICVGMEINCYACAEL